MIKVSKLTVLKVKLVDPMSIIGDQKVGQSKGSYYKDLQAPGGTGATLQYGNMRGAQQTQT